MLFRILCEPLVKFKIAANHQAQRESASRRSTAMRRIESAGAPHRMRHLMNVIYEKSGASVLEGLHQSAAGERYDGSPGSQGLTTVKKRFWQSYSEEGLTVQPFFAAPRCPS